MTDTADFSLIRVVIAFSVVMGLMAGFAFAMKHLAARGFFLRVKDGHEKRLRLMESLPLDAKRRAVILKCDDKEHLLLLGTENDIVIETNLSSTKNQQNHETL